MPVGYYALIGEPQARRELPDVESIQIFLIENARDNGELFVANIGGLKVVYDLENGKAYLDNIDRKEITIYMPTLLSPIEQAMQCVAKAIFIEALYTVLVDQGLRQLVDGDTKIKATGGKIPPYSKHEDVNIMLWKILNYARPMNQLLGFFSRQHYNQTPSQKAMFQAFLEFNLYPNRLEIIDSKKTATAILQKISENLRHSVELSPIHRP